MLIKLSSARLYLIPNFSGSPWYFLNNSSSTHNASIRQLPTTIRINEKIDPISDATLNPSERVLPTTKSQRISTGTFARKLPASTVVTANGCRIRTKSRVSLRPTPNPRRKNFRAPHYAPCTRILQLSRESSRAAARNIKCPPARSLGVCL